MTKAFPVNIDSWRGYTIIDAIDKIKIKYQAQIQIANIEVFYRLKKAAIIQKGGIISNILMDHTVRVK